MNIVHNQNYIELCNLHDLNMFYLNKKPFAHIKRILCNQSTNTGDVLYALKAE